MWTIGLPHSCLPTQVLNFNRNGRWSAHQLSTDGSLDTLVFCFPQASATLDLAFFRLINSLTNNPEHPQWRIQKFRKGWGWAEDNESAQSLTVMHIMNYTGTHFIWEKAFSTLYCAD